MTASLWIYGVLTQLAQPLLRRKLRKRAVAEPGYGEAVPERFGFYASEVAQQAVQGPGRWIWIHAVSLGETRAAAILLEQLRTLMPDMRLLLTHGTATGRAQGRKLLRAGDIQVWQPWDTPQAVRRFLQQFQPAIGVLMETEVWPNLVHGCQQAGVPLVLANARLNEKSLRGAQRWSSLLQPSYAGLHAVWAQTQADAQRLRLLGAPVQGVFGNLKFDVVVDEALLAKGIRWKSASRRPVIIFASSREGEEALWLSQWQSMVQQQGAADCQWLLVPRHPQRFDAVYALLRQAGLRVARRSEWVDGMPVADADVWLGDSLGEMPLYYAAADVGLLGGSFEPLGGQNLIEAAACSCPMVLGPHTFNFAQASEQACAQGAAFRVEGMAQAMELATRLVHDSTALAAARRDAQAFAQSQRGAAQATAQAILSVLAQRPHGGAAAHA